MRKPEYDKEALKKNIERCISNIKLFGEVIEKEKAMIEKLKRLIKEIEAES
ncbi:MAG: hypothetical protein AB1414_01315 [bacterium]